VKWESVKDFLKPNWKKVVITLLFTYLFIGFYGATMQTIYAGVPFYLAMLFFTQISIFLGTLGNPIEGTKLLFPMIVFLIF
jgi:hypothetical protein